MPHDTDEHSTAGEVWVVHVRRNPSWAASIRTTFKRVIYYGPSSWWWLVGPPLRGLLSALVVVPALTIFWLLSTCCLFAAGMCGFITEADEPEGR